MAERRAREPGLVTTEHDHVQGERSAPVTLLEYTDFECPYSQAAVQAAQALQREFGPDLRFVFRHFPLNKRPHALQASEAAEAAAAQGALPHFNLWTGRLVFLCTHSSKNS